MMTERTKMVEIEVDFVVYSEMNVLNSEPVNFSL